MADEYIIKVKADTKDAEKDIEGLGSKFSTIGKTITAAASALAIKELFTKAIDEAKEAEEATKGFANALALAGKYSEQAVKSFDEFAKTLERTTGISGDLITKNAALLVSVGRLSGEGLERATKAALDLSAGLQIDVSSAFDIMTKAANGNVMSLSKYGLEVEKTATDSQKFASALGFVESRFKGLAATNIDSFAGSMKLLGNSVNNLFEAIGNKIIKDPAIQIIIKDIAESFSKMGDAIEKSTFSITPLIQGFLSLSSVVLQYVYAPIESLARMLWSNFLTLPILIVGALSQIAMASDAIIGTNFAVKLEAVRQKISDLQQTIIAPVSGEEDTFATRFGKQLDELNKKIDESAKNVKKLPKAINDAGNDIKKDSLDISKTVEQGLAQSIAKGIGTIVDNVMRGKMAFKDFAANMANVMGDLSIQVGTMLIAFGIGLGALMVTLNPALMIAAGAALVAIGAVLKSFASVNADAASVNPANTGGVAGSESSYGSNNQQDEANQFVDDRERQGPNTGVQVIVQGNILDRRETGLAIAEIINESFYTNGTIITANA